MAHKVKIRMYRQGLGDCFLVSLPREGRAFHLLVDCGVILGTETPAETMTAVVEDIAAQTDGKLDLLIATHEHWDHLSGFLQAPAAWSNIAVSNVWLPWTENPEDPLAKKLGRQRRQAVKSLRMAQRRLRGMRHANRAVAAQVEELQELLGFFGAGSNSTSDALDAVRALGAVDYRYPGEKPIALRGTGARVFVLGPPHDEKQIKRTDPSKKNQETYSMSAMSVFAANMESALEGKPDSPFPLHSIPLERARQMPFFRDHYYAPLPSDQLPDQDWRTVDAAWLGSASDLALKLNDATNNTSLAFALELKGGDVLLFAADAQVGSWLSWQELRWEDGRKEVGGPELLARSIFYKVGHHGSHNATLRTLGLEQMTSLQYAMLPVDADMAKKKRWHHMPLPGLVEALERAAKKGVIRSDARLPAKLKRAVREDALFYELEI